jgi:hypothetical protein
MAVTGTNRKEKAMDDYTDNVKPDLCPVCATRLVYDESEDGYWCEGCLEYFMGYLGQFIPFRRTAEALGIPPHIVVGLEPSTGQQLIWRLRKRG